MKRITSLFVLMAFCSATVFPGCGTLFNDKVIKVGVTSDPHGAQIYVDGQQMGTTPTQLELSQQKSHQIEFQKDGYQKSTIMLTNRVGALWVILDILFMIWPVIVDAATGNWYELERDQVSVIMSPAGTTAGAVAPAAAPQPAPQPVPSDSPSIAGHIKKHTQKSVVAVFDIQDKSSQFSDKVLDQLTDYLAAQLTEVAGYRVAPREQLRKKLDEDKKKSHKERFDSSYQVELGKALSAQKTLITKIIQVGNKCSISSTLFNLETETMDKAASYDTSCSTEELMGGIKQIAVKLAID